MKVEKKKEFVVEGICPLVEAACCISAGGRGYDIDKDFTGWVKEYIKVRLDKNK